MTRASDQFEKQDHPFDVGYWRRYDGEPLENCTTDQERDGWKACNEEIGEPDS